VVDAARQSPFTVAGRPLAGGLALVEPDPGMLYAFNAAPGTIGPVGQGAYGPYAQALAEMIREGGLPLPAIFDRVRLRVNDMTKGAEVPWHASKITAQVVFFERGPDAPPPQVSPEETAAISTKPIRDFDERDAYIAALERDTLDAYLDFLAAYPRSPYAKRVHAIVAARREAIVWRRTRSFDTPQAYWSYLRRYPRGPHAGDAERRLAYLSAELEPPPAFAMVDYDIPPPPPDEMVYVERPAIYFADPVYAFAPPPPPPVFFLPPPDPDFVVLPAPIAPVGLFLLPVPIYRPVPLWVRTPTYVAPPPPNNVIYNNIHNTVVINNTTNTVQITNRTGQTNTFTAANIAAATSPAQQQRFNAQNRTAPGGSAAPAVASIGPALPPSVAVKAATIPPGTPRPGQPGAASGPSMKPAVQQPLNKPLPGAQGQPLPPGAPATASRTPPGARRRT
jgi:uncharacterized caspase-like protein